MNFLNKDLCYHYYTVFFNFIVSNSIAVYLYIHNFIKKIINEYFHRPCIDEITIVSGTQITTSNKLRGKEKINITDLYNLFGPTIRANTFITVKYYYNEQYYQFILNYNVISLLYNHIPTKQIFPFVFDRHIHCPGILSIEMKNESDDSQTIDITEFIMSFIGPHSDIYPIPHSILFKDIIPILFYEPSLRNHTLLTLMDSNLETHVLSFDAKLKIIESHK